ncbi:MAG TPA: hypothetical protein PK413_05350 [Thermoanaerobaculia bacterium]|nr:hypothetical protein [Thermoanaerobaculia bacterium]
MEQAASRSDRAWYFSLVGGLLPILLSGFLASGAADRLDFALWALVAGAAWAAALRQSFDHPRAAVRLGAPALVAALAVASFAWLAVRHQEDLRLGIQALLPVGGAP